jgi:hypothetical protein
MNKTLWWQKAVLMCMSILLSVFTAEMFLRLLYPAQIKYFVWQPNLRHVFLADTTILKGVQPSSRFTINADGVRTEQSQVNLFSSKVSASDNNKKYYLCLGGSTAECLYLDDSLTWPAQLMRNAQAAHDSSFAFVGNIGKSGCSTRENYIQLKYCVSQYKKINAVIVMAGLNDFLKRLSQDTLWDADFRFTPHIEDSLVNTIFIKEGRNIGKTWWRRTALFYLLHNLYHQNNPTDANWLIQDDNGRVYKAWRNNRQHACAILDSLPDMQSALNEYARNVNLMIDEAHKQHLGIIFVNQSALWKAVTDSNELSKLWMGGVGKYQMEEGHIYYSAGALRRGLEMYNRTLAKVCAARNVSCIDIDSQLPHDTSIFYDDCHFTDYGAALAAKIIYAAMKQAKYEKS